MLPKASFSFPTPSVAALSNEGSLNANLPALGIGQQHMQEGSAPSRVPLSELLEHFLQLASILYCSQCILLPAQKALYG